MKSKVFLRPSIAIVFVFIGAYVARGGTPPEIFAITGNYFTLVAALAFGTFGFILPDIIELAGKAGITVIAKEISERIPTASPANIRSRLSFKRKRQTKKYESAVVVDTSVFVDGRIIEIAKTGFLIGTLLVIPSVVRELQQLADSRDDIRRQKGRRGLDILSDLKKIKKVKLEVLKTDPRDLAVDEKLVTVARKYNAKLMTVDFNLNKSANVRGVGILNINELASAVKTAVLPHEVLDIAIVEKGKEKNQGIGYLADGTMVVVENGIDKVGTNDIVKVKVRKVIQTAAGRMIFTKLN